jgi:crotonobetainyl-CoA:carnitine CoA-transferase CaiB-like acyl-CoA transferase
VREVSTDSATAWARSGLVALTGRPGGPPLVPPGRAASVAGEIGARLAELSRGTVRVDGAGLLAERAAYTGHTRRGDLSVGGYCRLLRTRDGWAAVSCARPDDPALLGALIGASVAADPWPALTGWLAEHSGAELAERAELLGVAAAPVGPDRAGPVCTAAAPPPSPVAAAPPSPLATALPAPLATALPAPVAARPVRGLLVVDFSALWAGPLCAHLLGLAGARVVKVETPTRPDGARRGAAAFYELLHGGHRSVVLDPETPGGRRAMAALVAAADIVVESSRPRALAGFGLDAEATVAAGASWVSITSHGRGSNRVGFGDDVAAGSGLVAHGRDGAPLFCGDALADPLTGLTAAALAMTAPAGGGGVLWDVAMSDVVAATLGPAGAPRTPSPCARWDGGRWMVDTETGPVPVAPPRPRCPAGPAAASGAHTAEVLRELGIPSP